jgi:hypothetical protein
MKTALLSLILFFISFNLFAQVDRSSDLFRTLKTNDSLLFNVGYNKHDIRQFDSLISENFEFYHDEAGITSSKSAFLTSIKDGLFKLPYNARRALEEKTLNIYPLKKNGVLYGAIQTGTHRFYAKEPDKPEYLTSTAKFTHLWLLENGSWKLSRAYSYDHAGKE